MNKEDYKGIWVFAEQENGIIEPTVFELIAKAHELKKVNGENVIAVLMGYEVKELTNVLFEYGADEVIVLDNKALASYSARPYEKGFTYLAKKYLPSIVLFGATALGRDLAPRIMVALETGLTSDAIELTYDEDGVFCQTIPGYGGKIYANITIPEIRPQMVTVHKKICPPLERVEGRSGNLTEENCEISEDTLYEVTEVLPLPANTEKLEGAKIVVAAGRGIKSEADIAMLKELSDLLGGQIASSRPIVDVNWLTHDRQIGQSGTTVVPDLIINVGVSGSVQYQLGMNKSKCIVSVNTSEDAPIMDISGYGVIEDYRTFIPALIEALKEKKGE